MPSLLRQVDCCGRARRKDDAAERHATSLKRGLGRSRLGQSKADGGRDPQEPGAERSTGMAVMTAIAIRARRSARKTEAGARSLARKERRAADHNPDGIAVGPLLAGLGALPCGDRMTGIRPLRTLPVVQKSCRPCENSATRYVAPKFRGLRPRRAVVGREFWAACTLRTRFRASSRTTSAAFG